MVWWGHRLLWLTQVTHDSPLPFTAVIRGSSDNAGPFILYLHLCLPELLIRIFCVILSRVPSSSLSLVASKGSMKIGTVSESGAVSPLAGGTRVGAEKRAGDSWAPGHLQA